MALLRLYPITFCYHCLVDAEAKNLLDSALFPFSFPCFLCICWLGEPWTIAVYNIDINFLGMCWFTTSNLKVYHICPHGCNSGMLFHALLVLLSNHLWKLLQRTLQFLILVIIIPDCTYRHYYFVIILSVVWIFFMLICSPSIYLGQPRIFVLSYIHWTAGRGN